MNNKTPLVLLALVAVIVLGALSLVSLNNRLVALRENCGTAWAQVDTVLQRRFDLIPNLVATVKGYAAHEKDILEDVTRLRSQWAGAATTSQKAQTASQLEGVIGRLLVVAERYPDLKANENFRDLQAQLEGTENRITVERQRYNEAVRAYNTAVQQFPGSLLANMRGFKTNTAYFESAPATKEAPKVDFGTHP